MNITFVLQESICDCRIQISDSRGTRQCTLSAMTDEENTQSSITTEVFDTSCNLTLLPVFPDIEPALSELEAKSWTDKLIKKATKLLIKTVDNATLRASCVYPITNLQDGDQLHISMQCCFFGNMMLFDLFEFLPVSYVFFEVSKNNSLFKMNRAYSTNRKDVLKFARKMSLVNLLSYPLQVGWVKHMTKDKKVSKALIKFSNLSEADRQKFLEKQEKFMAL